MHEDEITHIALTPNKRLSAALSQENEKFDYIYPLSEWVESIFNQNEINKNYSYINPFSQQLLFEKIINNSPVGQSLLKTNLVGKSALKAYKYCQEFNLDLSSIREHSKNKIDFITFIKWCEEYKKILEEKQWLDYYSILNLVVKYIKSGVILLPNKITFISFTEIPPIYENLIDLLNQSGVEIFFYEPKKSVASCYKNKALDFKQELEYAAAWAKQKTIGYDNVAIIVPNLEQVRDDVISVFNNYFVENSYNVSAPIAIGKYDLINLALSLLGLGKNKIEFKSISYILRSPYIKFKNATNFELIKLELYLRKSRSSAFSWKNFISKLEIFNSDNEYPDDKFIEFIDIYKIFFDSCKGNKTLSDWVLIFESILELFGWPGGREQQALEEQLLVCWKLLLNNFKDMSFIVSKVSFYGAFNLLYKLALDTPFLPETKDSNQLQVLGMLEACGIEFDAVWITGMNDTNFPSDPNPNPFIPLSLQVKKDIPRSSSKREYDIAKKIIGIFKKSVKKELIFSFSGYLDDTLARESPLIKDLILKNDVVIDSPKSFISNKLEVLNDSYAPKLKATEELNSGAGIIKLQSICPFRAFTEIRLKAKALENPIINITKAERGEIVHQVLASFWNKIKSSKKLKQLSDLELRNTLNVIIDGTLQTWQHKNSKFLTDSYLMLEKKRIFNSIVLWLEIEKKRIDFEVYQIEKTNLINIGPLQLKLRVDRIDKINDSTYVLIDYKTANTEVRSWFGERPTEPQLPLYAVCSNLDFSAITFAVVNHSEKKYKGISSTEDILPEVSTLDNSNFKQCLNTWIEQTASWGRILSSLAQKFYDGDALIDPKDKNISCTFCNFNSICRK